MDKGKMVEVSKGWDADRGRMTLLVKNGPEPIRQATVEDRYPGSLIGTLCFARAGGSAPTATASAGKITWRLTDLKPGEVRELVYTALTQATLNDPAAEKRPLEEDRASLEAAKGVKPTLMLVDRGPEPLSGPSAQTEPEATGPEKPEGLVISIGAGKGGTGKTTFAINLAVALSEMGFETALVDADASMSNLGPYLGIDVRSLKATLHEVLAGEAEPHEATCRAFNGRLKVAPCGLSIDGFLKMDRNLLAEAIRHFSLGSSFVIVDTPAGYSKEMALSLQASDYLILVLNPDEGSLIDGLKLQEMARILQVKVLGIVLNRHDMKGHRFTRSQVEAHFGTPVIAMLPEDANVRRKDRVPVVLASPGSCSAREIVKVAQLISGARGQPAPDSRPLASRLMKALLR